MDTSNDLSGLPETEKEKPMYCDTCDADVVIMEGCLSYSLSTYRWWRLVWGL